MTPKRGWPYIHHLDHLAAQAHWWERYTTRLTPQEAKRIRHGSYASFWRPCEPSLPTTLEVCDRLTINLDVELRKGRWRCRITRVQDFRPPHSESVGCSRTYEWLDNVATLANVEGRVGDPERMDPPPEDARHRRASWRRGIIEGV